MAADPETFQHYQVLKRADGSLHELGRGAMGLTYKAFDTNLRCFVALKVVNAHFLHSETAQARFLREARAAAGLSHPNVAAVFHLGQSGDNYFYAMEFIDGETLDAFVRRRGPLPAPLALRIALQVAQALRAAHRIGLVHRDIKPSNLMLRREAEEGEAERDEDIFVKVIDFGLAKNARKEGTEQASMTLTQDGFVGTPHFASPEQLDEKEIDTRSDIYSLGVTLWYMLAGRPPFSGSVAQIMSQHLSRTPPFDQLAEEGVPPAVVDLLRHLLQKSPDARPQTPGDLRRELEAVMEEVERSCHPLPPAVLTVAEPGEQRPALDPALAARAPEEPDATVAEAPPGEEGGRGVPGRGLSTGVDGGPGAVTGAVLLGRYRLLHRLTGREDGRGLLYQAQDLTNQGLVSVKLLHPELASQPDGLGRLAAEVRRVQAAEHPHLVRVHGLEGNANLHLLVSEWTEGFSLLDLLRHRHQLPAAEVFPLLAGLAQAADHARTHRLGGLDFSLGQVVLCWQGAASTGEAPVPESAWLSRPLPSWPPHLPKVFPLKVQADEDSSVTWTGEQTMLDAPAPPRPGAAAPAGPPASALLSRADSAAAFPAASSEGSYLRRVARLAYELLGGSGTAATAPDQSRIPPLPALSERGNSVLRQALTIPVRPVNGTAGGPGAGDYASVQEFVRELVAASADHEPARLPAALLGGRTALTRAGGVTAASAMATDPTRTGGGDRPPVVPSPLPAPPPAADPGAEPAGGRSAAVPVRAGRGGGSRWWLSLLLVLGLLLVVSTGVALAGYLAWRVARETHLVEKFFSVGPRPHPTPPVVVIPTPVPTSAPSPEPSPDPSPSAPVVVRRDPSPTPAPTRDPGTSVVLTHDDDPAHPPSPTPEPSRSPAVAAATSPTPAFFWPVEPTPTPHGPDPSSTRPEAGDPGREARYLEAALRADRLDKAGETAGALTAYLDLARDYPEHDTARSGLDSVVVTLRAQYPPDGSPAGVPRFEALRPLLEKSADAGSVEAMLYLGDTLAKSDPESAAHWYRLGVRSNHPKAMLALANMYFSGRGVEKDQTQTVRLYQQASDLGDAMGKVLLGECYLEGIAGLPRDVRRGFALLNDALVTDPHNTQALYKLGICYDKGIGTLPDPKRALDLYERSASGGNLEARANLGVYYLRGSGMARPDPKRAVELFREGAEKNHAPSMFYYAQCLEGGIGVARRNPNEARVWYLAAAQQHFPPAIEWCRRAHLGP